MNNTSSFYHAIYIDKDSCIGCTRCLKNCPTKSIRIVQGVADIDESSCIDCGECMRVCLANAVKIEQGCLESIFKYKYRVALIPTVLSGQFNLDVTTDQIYKALHLLGFTHVYEEEESAEFQIEAIRKFQKETYNAPVISTFCPAIVRLVQVRFPTLTGNLVLIKSLIDITAMAILEDFKEKGISPDEIGIFYITPCPAKIVAIKSPVGDKKTLITDTISLEVIYDLIRKKLQVINETDISYESRIHLTKAEVKWSLTGGEAKHAFGRSLSIDGLANVTEFLDKVDDEAIDDIDFLELRACDQSCPGGVLCPGNRFLTVEKLGMRASQFNAVDNECFEAPTIDFPYEDVCVPPVLPRQQAGLDSNISVALKKMEKVHNYTCYLPGFDCGGCGAPDCYSFAKDVVNDKASLSNCVFLQFSNNILDHEHGKKFIENVWGKKRLQKDCTKKGARE
jgi:ferredoxin